VVAVSRIGALAELVTKHSKAAIAVMLVLTLVVGAGAPMVSQSSSLDQFQSETDASEKLDYIEQNFQTGAENTTTAQIVVRDGNVLSKDSLVQTVEFERALYENETVSETLSEDAEITGIANVVAKASIRAERGRQLQQTSRQFQELNRTVQQERAATEERSATLNRTSDLLRAELTYLRNNPDASIQASFEDVRANTSVQLGERDYGTFEQAAKDLRNATNEEETRSAYRLGTTGILGDDYQDLQDRVEDLEQQAAKLEELGQQLRSQQAALENARNATLDEQLAQLELMNESEIESMVTTVLGEDRNGGNGGTSVFGLMPSSYEPGSTSAEATMLVVTQTGSSAPGGQTTDQKVIDAQLAMQSIGEDREQDYLVFGAGIISNEINASMADSLLIVGPLAIIFVMLALAIAYRDLIDIVLGLFGIGAVLTWTFGFMGWTDIAFNQIFIAVPVLLIGLSIDYAIHIFMRHREERAALSDAEDGDAGLQNSMRIALSGVGIALIWVTATTVIGFLSNLTSPVPPIQEFGVVSSFGIVAALAVFGVLIPALKVEIDGFLEGRGWDRRKRAFGTGGGRFSNVLAVGSTAARKAPAVVLVLTLVVTAAGAYGGTQVDTSFNQEDFLAEDPADWMKDLPEPFAPQDYSAKENMRYVNERFSPENSQAQILIQGPVTADNALERVQAAREAAAGKEVTYELSNGEPGIQDPLSTMRSVAAQDEAFAATFEAADTDGDGVPDQDLESVYDALYAAAPQQAENVVHRTDGDYDALRMVVSVSGDASGADVTTQMRDVADVASSGDLEATATGSAILNKLVQDQLLDTVIQSLLITLVAVFAFLMLIYRLTDGSATLGAVTLLPVVLSVAWILGTMFLMGIPFNVLTGMITSLTVGLGVAYSIHLSERYVQELERSEDVWEAMRTAVTGTGGALLGSAATTVGGFGVLAFAILPPLQQFGIITGLTIIYAFLAAVLVLPTLLVVWTKYLGPDWVTGMDVDDSADYDDDTTAPATAPGSDAEAAADDDPVGEATADNPTLSDAGADDNADSESVANDDVDSDAVSDDDADSNAAADDAVGERALGAPDAASGADEPHRELDRDLVQPGGTVTATVDVPTHDGRVVLSETVRGGTVTLLEATPDPVDTVVDSDTVYVAWRLDDEPAMATYEIAVSDTAPDGSDLTVSGSLLGDGGERDVGGDAGATVVADIFERVFAQADVTDDDLEEASAALEQGDLTADQYDRVVREWARDRPDGE
jgi:predicted RND superfamily exporter protein